MGKSYKDLIVWQKSYALCLLVYENHQGLSKERIVWLDKSIKKVGGIHPIEYLRRL